MNVRTLQIIRPDDWHLHLRDGSMLRAVLPSTSSLFGRAIIMPNLKPPVRTLADLRSYRRRIEAALPAAGTFRPLMTLYLTEDTDPAEIDAGAESGELTAVKLYPAGATTNSDNGVKDIARVEKVLETMQRLDVPLLVHGEVTDPEVDIFDREAVFIERVLEPLRRRFPALRVVLEHVTTRHGVDYVQASSGLLGATITPHHLMINRTDIFRGGIRPHLYCLPIAKREEHRLALRRAATSGDARFFLGTDSAPHAVSTKEAECGCAGIFNAPVAIACLAQVFEEENALDRLEAFASRGGPAFYRLPSNGDTITLQRTFTEESVFADVAAGGEERVRVFRPDSGLRWSVLHGAVH
ncbi:MAG: dihydroorotase [Rhizobiales bacterium]|nr:dihydroorotase [Hyphomicrobiales bacterium]